jgi:glycosyltransferase involved in cell wall biosynthesis
MHRYKREPYRFLTFEKDTARITTLRKPQHLSKNNTICIVTSPVGRAAGTPLSNLLKLCTQSSDQVYLICNGDLSQSLKLDKKVFVFEVAHQASSNAVMRAVNYIRAQFTIMHYMLVVSKETNLFIFFLGGEHLLIPMLASKFLRKKTLLMFSEIARKVYAVRKDPLSKFISMIVSINSCLATKLVLYSHNLINEGNFKRFKHKIIIAHRHFVDFNQFMIQEKINKRSDIVGYIGRFKEEKGILNLVESIPMVLKHRRSVHFVLCGEGDLFDEVRAIIKKKDLEAYVKLTGWVSHEEIPFLLNDFKLLVLPSYTEGLPNVILEAMACGTPVLATSVGGIPDIVTEGKTGFLLKSTVPGHIAERITYLFKHQYLLAKVSKNAYNFVRDNFEYEKTLGLWRDILLHGENK